MAAEHSMIRDFIFFIETQASKFIEQKVLE